MKSIFKQFWLYVGLISSITLYAYTMPQPQLDHLAINADRLHKPPPSLLYHVASLGRPAAAADLLWLRAISFIGLETNESNGYPGLEHYLDRITDLAPSFELPYWIGGILLATSPGRSGAADKILAKGEKRYPNNWEFSQWRGFAAYFGEMNVDKALMHYRKSVSKPGYPPYLKSFIKRLEKSKNDCRFLAQSLQQLLKRQDNTTSFLNSKSGKIIKSCIILNLKQAAASYRLKEQDVALNIETLLSKNYIKEIPPSPPGFCWSVLGKVELLPCEEIEQEKIDYLKFLEDLKNKKDSKAKAQNKDSANNQNEEDDKSDAGNK